MRRAVLAVVGAAGFWLVSCREVPSPAGGIFSISGLLLPSPGLVVGDTMRDSTGMVAPLRVIAFDAGGDTVQSAVTTFVVLDTGAHLAGALLIGDSLGRTIRVVGTVGELQTQPASVKITVAPDTLVAADSVVHRMTYLATDTAVTSPDLTTIARHRATSAGVEAVVVRYALPDPPTVFSSRQRIVTTGNTSSDRDTTDTGGRAARAVRLRTVAGAQPGSADSAIVTAMASYRGRSLGVVTFVVVFTRQ